MIITVMLARQTTSLRTLPASLSSLHSVNCSLLPLFFRLSPFGISNLQPLFAKHPGWGTPNTFRAKLRFRRHMHHVAPLSPVSSFDCAYFPSPRGCASTIHSNGRAGYDRGSRAANAEALRCAMASMEIMGFTPEAFGKAEPSMT